MDVRIQFCITIEEKELEKIPLIGKNIRKANQKKSSNNKTYIQKYKQFSEGERNILTNETTYSNLQIQNLNQTRMANKKHT